MAVFNWTFLKKSLFTLATSGLSATPLIFINKWGVLGSGGYVSDFKKNFRNISSNYADKFGLVSFSKEIFKIQETKPIIEEVFASDIALQIMKSNDFFKQQFSELTERESSDHDRQIRDFSYTGKHIQQFYDFKGGSREDMKRMELSSRAMGIFKNEILNFGRRNFTILTNDKKSISERYVLTKTILDNKDNWEKIKFYPIANEVYKKHSSFLDEKFNFLNYVYDRWFQESKPFYVHMSLWKYKDKATESELKKVWKLEKLKEEKFDLTSASYNFPYFEEKNVNGLSSVEKFNKFFQDKVKNYSNSSNIHISKGYTDDSATSIFVEGSKMYDKLYIKFAAASNYKYLKDIQKSQKMINMREKSWSDNTSSQPFRLFQFSPSTPSTSQDNINARMKVFKDMFVNNGNNFEVADAVEVKDTPWIFIRNEAGIHAIASDTYNKTDFFKRFKYRTLQLSNRDSLRIDDALDIDPETPFRSFSEYLKENFDRLLVKYILSEQSSVWKQKVDISISEFKDAYAYLEKFYFEKKKYLEKLKLRESLLSTYVKKEWKTNTNKKYDRPLVSYGMSGFLPYTINDKSDDKVFDELEPLYDHDFLNDSSNNISQTENDIGKYIDKLSLTLNKSIGVLKSDRVFTNNYIINRIIDKFLDKEEVFNEFLFIYNLKNDYLGKSLLGKKLIVDSFIKVPTEWSSSSSDSTFFDSISDSDIEKNKKLFGKLEDLMMSLYYSHFFLEESNPWMILKYSGKIIKTSTSDTEFAQTLKEVALSSFKDKFKYNINGIRNKHFAFLNTLSYLMADNFTKFREWIKSNIDYTNDSYLLFSKLPEQELYLHDKSFKNPFFSYDLSKDNGESLSRKIHNIDGFLISKMFKDSSNKITSDHNYLGLFVNSEIPSTYSGIVPSEDKSKFNPKSLYRFGNSPTEAIKYVQQISTDEEYKRIVRYFSTVADKADKMDFLESDVIYISKDSSKELRYLTLQEKKNLLISALNSKKIDITSNTIAKDKYKDIFSVDPDNGFVSVNPSSTSTTSTTEEKISKTKYFTANSTANSTAKASGDDKYRYFQIAPHDVKDFDSFKTYVNKNLSLEIFWSWVIHTSLRLDMQSIALVDMGNSIEKVQVYDLKWHQSGRKQFIS